MKDWAVILGASSGFGAAACRELASHGVNIYGVHLDRRATMNSVNALIDELKNKNVEVFFKNINAVDAEKRKNVIEDLTSLGEIHVKILMHSLAFGTLKPVIDDDLETNTIQQRQIEMTMDVMANSLIYWTQDLFKVGLLKQGSQIFAMTSSGGHRQWKMYGAVSAAKAGASCKELDAIPRNIIDENGYGEYFNHGTGHGLGLEIHTQPRLSKLSDQYLAVNNVVTVEPGIYLPGWGGVRIEDDIIIEENGCEVLNTTTRELVVL